MNQVPTRRSHLFGVALFIASCIACVSTYLTGTKTGVLRLASRQLSTVTFAENPERFQFWLNCTAIAGGLFGLLACICIWAVFRPKSVSS